MSKIKKKKGNDLYMDEGQSLRDCISEVSRPIWLKMCVLMGNGFRTV